MEEFVDYYEILELEKNAPIEEIEEAIKKTRKRFRRLEGSPDAMQRANAERMMQLLNEADSLFHNSSKRLEYDATYDSGKSDSKRDLEKTPVLQPPRKTGHQKRKIISKTVRVPTLVLPLGRQQGIAQPMRKHGLCGLWQHIRWTSMTNPFLLHPSC